MQTPNSPLAPRAAAAHFVAASPWFLLLVTALALGLRLCLFPHVSADYTVFLAPWMQALSSGGGFAAVGQPIGNYFVLYLYLLAGLTYLPLPWLFSIKLLSCVGDLALAFFCAKIAKKSTGNRFVARCVYAAVLLLPSVLLNSSAWAQCDALYTAALMACVYSLICEKPWCAMTAFGVAACFKLQAVFLAPLLLILLLRGRLRVRHFACVPLLYGVAMLPAIVAGRGFWDTATIYLRQAGEYQNLSIGAANPYVFLDARPNKEIFGTIGLVLFIAAFAVITLLLLRQKHALTAQYVLLVGALGAFGMAYLLPHMHERYFYPADILCLLYAATCFKKRWFLPVIATGTSALTVGKYLYGGVWINEAALAIPMGAALCVLLWDALKGCDAA